MLRMRSYLNCSSSSQFFLFGSKYVIIKEVSTFGLLKQDMVVFWYLCTKYRVSNLYYLERGRKPSCLFILFLPHFQLVTYITSRGDGNLQHRRNKLQVFLLVTYITSRGDGNCQASTICICELVSNLYYLERGRKRVISITVAHVIVS